MKIQTGQNNPILRKKSLRIKEVNSNIQKLARDMIDIMIRHGGIGLSACQVGRNIRLFVVNSDLIGAKLRSNIFINPEIIKLSKKTDAVKEGCLSLPDVFLKIERAKSLKIKALDENGKEFKLKAKDLLARVIQHENDHLDGILITDKIWKKSKQF